MRVEESEATTRRAVIARVWQGERRVEIIEQSSVVGTNGTHAGSRGPDCSEMPNLTVRSSVSRKNTRADTWP